MIYVYKPQYPSQALKEDPELYIPLSQSQPGLEGYLEPLSGHYVNHLIVGDLGNEEIVVAACDDGDVISYKTRAVGLAIEGVSLLKPWFVENVGASAWGLAIHTEARLLAVSSNTHNIEIFAPALTNMNDEDVSPHVSSSQQWVQVQRMLPEARSSRNLKISLAAHDTNVPSIAFYNSDIDRMGRYLASTDIDNNTFVWDIGRGETVFRHHKNSFQGSHIHQTSILGTKLKQTEQRGWSVVCLDPRFARRWDDPISSHKRGRYVSTREFIIDMSMNASSNPTHSPRIPNFSLPSASLPASDSAPAIQSSANTIHPPTAAQAAILENILASQPNVNAETTFMGLLQGWQSELNPETDSEGTNQQPDNPSMDWELNPHGETPVDIDTNMTNALMNAQDDSSGTLGLPSQNSSSASDSNSPDVVGQTDGLDANLLDDLDGLESPDMSCSSEASPPHTPRMPLEFS